MTRTVQCPSLGNMKYKWLKFVSASHILKQNFCSALGAKTVVIKPVTEHIPQPQKCLVKQFKLFFWVVSYLFFLFFSRRLFYVGKSSARCYWNTFLLKVASRSYVCPSRFLTLGPSQEFDMALGEQAVNRVAPKRFSTAYKYSGLTLETIEVFLGPLQRFKNANELLNWYEH